MVSNFVTYDIIFLALSVIFVIFFLYKRRNKIERQGVLYLYKTQVGVRFIDKFSKKYSKILKPMQYVVVAWGYILMVSIVYLFAWTIYIYLKAPASSVLAKIPAVFPLIPYFPQLLKIDSLFPPFYFTYFIIAIAIVTVVHEFSHGIFMRLNKIRIKSTGGALMGPILINLVDAILRKSKKALTAPIIVIVVILLISIVTKQWIWLLFLVVPFIGAFVEQNDKDMEKAKKFPQLSVLAAGTFSNTLIMIIFAILFWIFFTFAFVPAGIYFTPAYATINTSEISSMSTVSFSNHTYLELVSHNQTYFATPEAKPYILNKTYRFVPAFISSPAFNAQLSGAITEFDGNKITSYQDLSDAIKSKNPGDTVNVKTIADGNITSAHIILGNESGRAVLGIFSIVSQQKGILRSIIVLMNPGEDSSIYYESKLGSFGIFIKYLFWWIIFINFAVALSNMIPAGIFDGGHFFRLTVEAITRKKKVAEIAYKVATWIIFAALIVLILKWVFNVI